MKELSRTSGYPERSIRQYVLEGMVPRTAYHGKDTLYADVHLTALRAIRKLRDEHKMHRLEPLRAWFKGKSAEEIESFVTGIPLATMAPPPVAEIANVAEPEEESVVSPASRAPEDEDVGERWMHVPLVPGMVLLVKEGAPELVRRLAGEIRGKYGAG